MKKYFIIFIITVLSTKIGFAQTFNGSLKIEGAGLVTRTLYYNYFPEYRDLGVSHPIEYGLGIYWSGKWDLGSDYKVEFKPGFFFASSRYFSMLQLGLFLQRNINETYFGSVGINFGQHFIGEGNLLQLEPILSMDLSVGKKITDRLLINITISRPFDTFNSSLYTYHAESKSSKTYLDFVVKLGIEWDF